MSKHVFCGVQPSFQLARAEHVPATVSSGKAMRKLAEFTQLFKRRILHVLALGVAVGGSELLNTYPVIVDIEGARMHMWIAMMLLNRVLDLLVVVAACSALQIWIAQPRRRVLALTVVVIASGIVISAVQSSEGWMRAMEVPMNLGTPGMSMFLYIVWLNTAFAGLLAILYEWQMRADLAMLALSNTRIADEALERQTLESRLSGMKARVDPEFLFTVIAHTQQLYLEDIDAAERLLEKLIEFLRATLPRTSEAKATLDLEIKLCRAYLEIEKALREEDLSVQTKAHAGAASSYFPPSVLLPLLQTLLTPRGQTMRPMHLSITTEQRASRVRIELTGHAVLAPPSQQQLLPAVVALRALFGENVTVVAKSAPFTGITIYIEVPYVAA